MNSLRVTVIGLLLLSCSFAIGTQVKAGEIASPSPATSLEQVPFLTPEVKFSGGLLSVQAKDADLRKLLEAVGENAGVALHIDPAVQSKVSVEFTGKGLKEALGVILGQVDGNNFLSGYDRDEKVKEIWILPKGANASVADEDLRLRRFNEEDKKYLREKYGSLQVAVWEVFGKIYGKGRWDSREWNPAFDRPPTLSGAWTLEGDVLGSQESALAFGLSFIKTYENLLQTRTEDLRINPRLTKHGNGYGFVFDQYQGGVPVEQGIAYIGLAPQGLSLANSTFPGVQVSTIPKITPEEATARAIEENEKYYVAENRRFKIKRDLTADEKLRRGDAVLVILPVAIRSSHYEPPYNGSPKGYAYYLTYRVPFLEGHYYIDAQTGSLVLRATDTFKLTATVSGQVFPDRSYTDNAGNLAGSEQASLQNLNVRLNGNPPVHTNSTGQYSYNTTDSVHLGLESTFDGGRDFVIVAEDAQKQDVPWDVNQSGNFPFDADPGNGFRPNAYYWADKASTWFFNNLATIINVDEAHGTRVRTTIRTNHVFPNAPDTLGEAKGNWNIWFRPAAGSNLAASIFPDILLHELSHAAAYAKRGSVIAGTAYGQETGGVDESVADYFACRIAGNTDFFSGVGSSGNFNIDPTGSEANPKEHIGAGVLNDRDWQHYRNGSVIASTLWDLTKSVATDSILWDSLTTQWLTSYTPEALYDAIFEAAKDLQTYGLNPDQIGSQLWNTFSAHSMNLWARPNVAGGVLIDWFPHRSPNYQGYYAYRNTTGIFDENSLPFMVNGVPKFFPAGTTSWANLGASSSSTTYYFAVRAVSSDGQSKSNFSNVASSKGEPSGGSPPATPWSFVGSLTTKDGHPAVQLKWIAGVSTDVAEHVIERAENAEYTSNRVEYHALSDEFQVQDLGEFKELTGFVQDAKFYYRIKAVDLAGSSSPWLPMSPPFVIPVPSPVPPAKPTDLKGRGGNGGAKFTWTAPEENADGTDLNDLAGYRIYYDITPAFLNPSTAWSSDEVEEVTGLANDTRYFVRVKTVDTAGNESECSDTVTVRPQGGNVVWVHESGGPAGSQTSISDALATASNGSTIIVGDGTYSEGGLVIGDYSPGWSPADILLKSEHGPEKTTIIAGNIQVGDLSRVIGFTITNSSKALKIEFDEGVLVANNIFLSNTVAIEAGGFSTNPRTLEKVNRIYNNVFAGNATSFKVSYNTALTDIQNNIFEKTSSSQIPFDDDGENGMCSNIEMDANIFHGSGSSIPPGSDCLKRGPSNSTSDPNFERFSASDLPGNDYHLVPGSAGAIDKGATNLEYALRQGEPAKRWEDCSSVTNNRARADIGAYGGPFAYIDKNQNNIPDCEEGRGYAVAIAVLRNSVNIPVTLRAQNEESSGLAFSVDQAPGHGDLVGEAPELGYTVTPEYTGQDSFSFTVTNQLGVSPPAPVDITVKESNAGPIALNQSLEVQDNRNLLVTLQGTDSDGDALTYTVVSEPASGSLICLHPPECYFFTDSATHGALSFAYRASDGIVESAPATVDLLVNSKPSIIVTAPESSETPQQGPSYTVHILAEDVHDEATTMLYYDTDGEGYDGQLITADLPESQEFYEWDVSALPEGAYYVYAITSDPWSTSRAYSSGPLTIDRTPPQVSVDLEEGVYATAQAVNMLASETAVIHCTIDGSDPPSTFSICSSPLAISDTRTLKFLAVDLAGNVGPIVTKRYVIDNPPASISLSGNSIYENHPPVVSIGNLSTTDPDPGDFFTYELDSVVPDNNFFKIVGNKLQSNAIFDYEARPSHSYYILVRSKDQDGLSVETAFTIGVKDVFEPPTDISLSKADGTPAGEVEEHQPDGTAIGTLGTSDEDTGSIFIYSLVSQTTRPDDQYFKIDGNILKNKHEIVYTKEKHIYTIRVRSSDPCGLFVEKDFTITILDVNENPTDLILSALTMTENQPVETEVGKLTTTDPDPDNTFTYALEPGGADNNLFKIEGDSLRTKEKFDFETMPSAHSYTVWVRSTDQGGLFLLEYFTIAVTDANDPPSSIALSNASVVEKAVAGSPIGSLSSTDPDPGSTFTYTLTTGAGSADNAYFQIAGNLLKTNAVLTWQTNKPSYDVMVQTTDQGGLSREQLLTIAVRRSRVRDDFDGDRRSDIGLYYPAGGTWYESRSTQGNWQTQWGYAGTLPVTGDFDSDGKSDLGLYYPSGGNWYLMKSTEGYLESQFGHTGTIPFTGDFDGDGREDFGCYAATTGDWFVLKSLEGFWQTTFGYAGTIPIVGDFDGDGRDDIGCYYPPTGKWHIYKSRDGYWETQFGYTGTIPVVGDFDGDGRSDIGCYYPPGGNWYVFKSTEGFWQTTFGYAGTEPVVGDFDGDGKSDLGCYYPTGGNWYVFKSTQGFWQTQYGFPGTIPLGGTLR